MSPLTRVCAAAALVLGTLSGPSARAADVPGGAPRAATAGTTKVLVVSIDSLSTRAIRMLGRDGAPNLHRLLEEGAGTLNARTVRESTVTLPNHTSMVTGRSVRTARGGHGVWWDDGRRRPRTVQDAAGHPVGSVFSAVDSRRRHTGLFVSKPKLALFKRSWPKAVDKLVVHRRNGTLVNRVRADLVKHRRALTFVHLSLPDVVGHAHGFLGKEHLAAITRTDRRIGKLMRTIEDHPRLAAHQTLIVTSDHGGRGTGHSDPTRLVDYRIPFLVWGAGVAPGADLYDLNPDYRDPGKRRTRYGAKRSPVRNGDVANLVSDLLRLGPVPTSRFDADQDLDVR